MNLREISKLFYQLKLANQEMTSTFEKETGFSITRYELMMFLKEKGQCSQSVIQSELKIDSAAVTRHLKILEEKAYVTRERNKENNREVFVALTSEAAKALAQCEEEHQRSEQKVMLPLSEEEQQELLRLLVKLTR